MLSPTSTEVAPLTGAVLLASLAGVTRFRLGSLTTAAVVAVLTLAIAAAGLVRGWITFDPQGYLASKAVGVGAARHSVLSVSWW